MKNIIDVLWHVLCLDGIQNAYSRLSEFFNASSDDNISCCMCCCCDECC